ncbi:histidine kinase-like ATPase [Dipodascopsis uninucleata]
MTRIKELDESVVNRIAAGEIIVTPANALKEMLENSVDAASTAIDIVIKDGGLKILQITDNGNGINREDLPILCKRFTTSKLTSFDDLNSIATYGFRGEALASISHIAQITVTTRTKDSHCAWKAQYVDGKLTNSKNRKDLLQPAAGNVGTQIMVENLFYNVPSRLRAFRTPQDEYNRIVDIVGRYAIHCNGIAFTCKKHGDTTRSISISNTASLTDRIREIFGSTIARELVEIQVDSDRNLGLVGVTGLVTNANFNGKRNITPLFFINHRLVSCDPLRRAIMNIYSNILGKGSHAFIYVSLLISPDKLDVNVHPTKREVRFLNEDEIIQRISTSVQLSLGQANESRSFKTQTLLHNVSTVPASSSTSLKRKYDYNMVRTDVKERKLSDIIVLKRDKLAPQRNTTNEPLAIADNKISVPSSPDARTIETIDKSRINIRLSSVKKLRELVRESKHEELTTVFANHSYVGVVDPTRRLLALQYDVKLFLVDYGIVCYEHFYQIGLSDFGNFGVINLEPPLSLRSMLEIAVAKLAPDEKFGTTDAIERQIISNRAMLEEYFSFCITDSGEITGIPLLIKNYVPCIGKLPLFLYKLGVNINWTDELECFDRFLKELALFYTPESIPSTENVEAVEDAESISVNDLSLKNRKSYVISSLEECIFPSIKRRLIATNDLLSKVIEIANLPGLYRVFERC